MGKRRAIAPGSYAEVVCTARRDQALARKDPEGERHQGGRGPRGGINEQQRQEGLIKPPLRHFQPSEVGLRGLFGAVTRM